MSELATYAYLRPSGLTEDGGLMLQTSGGVAQRRGRVAHPRFFTGFVTAAEPVAVGLLAVAEVARTRYYRLLDLRSLDPVVTGSRTTCGSSRSRGAAGCTRGWTSRRRRSTGRWSMTARPTSM